MWGKGKLMELLLKYVRDYEMELYRNKKTPARQEFLKTIN